jgi:hypothetical protein
VHTAEACVLFRSVLDVVGKIKPQISILSLNPSCPPSSQLIELITVFTTARRSSKSPYLFMILSNITLPSTLSSPKWLLPFRFSDKDVCMLSCKRNIISK